MKNIPPKQRAKMAKDLEDFRARQETRTRRRAKLNARRTPAMLEYVRKWRKDLAKQDERLSKLAA